MTKSITVIEVNFFIYYSSGLEYSSTIKMWDIPFSLNSSWTLDIFKVGFLLMLTFWRLVLSPLSAMAFTMLSNQDAFVFQSVLISLLAYPQYWKLKNWMLYFKVDPKFKIFEHWIEQWLKISLSTWEAAFTMLCRFSSLMSVAPKKISLIVASAAVKNEFK